MGPARKDKLFNKEGTETLKIRPYRPSRQVQTPPKAKKANTSKAEKPAAAAPSTTSVPAAQEEEFPVSDATPVSIVIEDGENDTATAGQQDAHQDKDGNKDETEESKKNRGSWTPEKQIVLLQKYAEHFPPGAPWGKSTEAWQKIVDAVNAVAPNDTPLRYDACRRAVDRISERYMEEESIQKAAIAALAKRNKHEGEKADKLIQQESKKERKRMKRLIIQRLASERPIDIASRGFTPALPGPTPQYVNPPLPPPVFNYIQLDQAYVEEQREYQRSVLQHLESMNEILKDLSQRLQK